MYTTEIPGKNEEKKQTGRPYDSMEGMRGMGGSEKGLIADPVKDDGLTLERIRLKQGKRSILKGVGTM